MCHLNKRQHTGGETNMGPPLYYDVNKTFC